jgi:concanavalin A-like lectin/glucanase superfamily protein
MARHFDASLTSQYLKRTGAAYASRPLTLSCWVKPTTVIALSGMCAIIDTSGTLGGWYGRIDGSTHPRAMDFDGSSFTDAVAAASLTVGAWSHVACSFGSSSNFVYLNGVKSTAATPSSKTGSSSPATFVGALDASGVTYYWDGDLAEFAIYNATLTDAEVTQLAAGNPASAVRAANLAAYYPILGTTSPEPDVQGGTGLTLFGAPTSAPHPPMLSGFQGGRMFNVF